MMEDWSESWYVFQLRDKADSKHVLSDKANGSRLTTSISIVTSTSLVNRTCSLHFPGRLNLHLSLTTDAAVFETVMAPSPDFSSPRLLCLIGMFLLKSDMICPLPLPLSLSHTDLVVGSTTGRGVSGGNSPIHIRIVFWQQVPHTATSQRPKSPRALRTGWANWMSIVGWLCQDWKRGRFR